MSPQLNDAGRHHACRRFLLLLYATAVWSIGWYPWNVLLLLPLLKPLLRKDARNGGQRFEQADTR